MTPLEEWIEALLSGKYQQGREKLRPTDDTFCCLGVACDIAAQHGIGKWNGPGHTFRTKDNPADYSYTFLPDGVREWLDPDGRVNVDGLAEMNDGGATFEQIVAEIRTQLAGS